MNPFFIYFFVAIGVILVLMLGYFFGVSMTNHKWKDNLPEIRQEAAAKSRSVLRGLFSEQLAPYLPDFPYSPTEARFIGKPVDFIVFEGMDEKKINSIKFVEVKSGKAQLSTQEKELKKAIEAKKVSFEEYRMPEFKAE
jgi:predicted Holliday junction resolvase-like endonuclease